MRPLTCLSPTLDPGVGDPSIAITGVQDGPRVLRDEYMAGWRSGCVQTKDQVFRMTNIISLTEFGIVSPISFPLKIRISRVGDNLPFQKGSMMT